MSAPFCLCAHSRKAHVHFSADDKYQWLGECANCNCKRYDFDPFLEDDGTGKPRVSFGGTSVTDGAPPKEEDAA